MRTALIAVGIAALGSLQYLLMTRSIQDLLRRPSVRGDNKVIWALVILCLPIAGSLIYEWMGPTSFLHRPRVPQAGPRALDVARGTPFQPARPGTALNTNRPAPAKVTPISAARSRRVQSAASAQERIAAARSGRSRSTGTIQRRPSDTQTGS